MPKTAATALALLLAACAAAPPAQYFVLPDSRYLPPAETAGTQAAAPVGLRVLLAEPLARGSLVYQTDEVRLSFAKHHLWAEPLEHSLAAAFANRLNRLGSTRFVPAQLFSGSPSFRIHINEFQGSHHGHALVGGYLRHPDGRMTPFRILTPQQGDGYAAMVRALAQGLDGAAAAVAPALRP